LAAIAIGDGLPLGRASRLHVQQMPQSREPSEPVSYEMTNSLSAELLPLQEALAGRYSIERELGRGGMGVVLLARDVALDRLVAIKLLPAVLAADRDYRDRFLREARTAAGLSHPNIVPIHSVEELGELVFFVMGYVDGETLAERVERVGPLSPRVATRLMQEIAWALGYAHERGVVHRDIKPANIMMEQGSDRGLLTDFGIAQVGGPGESGGTGEVVGTARYMSPEQACGEPVDARSDIYSLAGTFFFALSGSPPFDGSNLPAIMAKQVSKPAPLIQSMRPEVPDQLASIIDTCLEKDPDHRLQSGDEIIKAVGEARGRDFRAPPLVRSFVRNAEVSTMVVMGAIVAGQGMAIGAGGANISVGGPGIIGSILLWQLVLLARRLLREGYTFDDIRAALLAEAKVQEEEAEEVLKRKWLRRMYGAWHRLWAGKFGRWFFKVSSRGIKPPDRPAMASTDATELVLGRAAENLYEDLSSEDQSRIHDLPRVVRRLENRAERLRVDGHAGEQLTDTVGALENVRLALLRLKVGEGSMEDLTIQLQRARDIGKEVDRQVAARREVEGIAPRT
jgi:hypothetical protein